MARNRLASWHCAARVGKKHKTSPVGQLAFAASPFPQLIVRRSQSRGAHECATRNAYAGKRGGRCPIVLEIPVDKIRRSKEVAQKAESGYKSRPAVTLRRDLQVFDFQQVAGTGTLDVNGSCKRVHNLRVHPQKISGDDARADLAIRRIARLENDFLQRLNFEGRWNVGVPAVVALIRLFGEPLRTIDRDALCHTHSAVFDGVRSARNRGTIGMRSHEKRNRKSKGQDLSKSLSSSAAIIQSWCCRRKSYESSFRPSSAAA